MERTTEISTKSKYVAKHGFVTSGSCKVQYYSCHRSGVFCNKEKRERSLKTQGSNKINAYCPAQIKVIKQVDGECKTNFLDSYWSQK